MKRFWNTNYVGSHFGGSLYSMTDPFYMFIPSEHLKKDHIIWDKSRYRVFGPAKGESKQYLKSRVNLEEIKARALKEFSFIREFTVEIVDENQI